MCPAPNEVFDKNRLRFLRDQAFDEFQDYDFLINATAQSIIERLKDITLDFEHIAIYGARISAEHIQQIVDICSARHVTLIDSAPRFLQARRAELAELNDLDITMQFILADCEWLPFGGGKLDAIISVFEHHSLNDLPGALIQARRALRPDGLFMAAQPGGESFYELRQSMNAVEIALYNGAAPHIHPFADKQQFGGLMQRAGFALPVVDSEYFTISYKSIFKALKDIRAMGEGNALNARLRRALPRRFFDSCETHYRKENGFAGAEYLDIRYEIIHLIGWAPAPTQQQPLKPGSAQKHLSDIL